MTHFSRWRPNARTRHMRWQHGTEMMTDMPAMRAKVDALIVATNAFDVEAALSLLTPRAVIDDPSTGERFDHHAGIRDYIERLFIGYGTVTRLLSVEALGERSPAFINRTTIVVRMALRTGGVARLTDIAPLFIHIAHCLAARIGRPADPSYDLLLEDPMQAAPHPRSSAR